MAQVDQWFLWPEPRTLRGKGRGLKLVSPRDLEEKLSEMFGKAATPVVVSSGRVGLVLALEALGVRRIDPVGLFGYASHCVIESVARVGSPVYHAATTAQHTRIVYHQWGYVQQYEPFDRLVEDAVDSFCLPSNNKKEDRKSMSSKCS